MTPAEHPLPIEVIKNAPTSMHLSGREAVVCGTRYVVSAAILAATAFLGSGYLAYVALTSSEIVGCDGGVFNCEHVLTSQWSKVLGVPVSLPAMWLYAIVLAAITNLRSTNESRRRMVSTIVMACASAAATVAAWFMVVQIFMIGHLCPYCIVVHICGVMLLALMLWQRPMSWFKTHYTAIAGIFAGLAMVGIQAATPGPQTYMIQPHETLSDPDAMRSVSDPLTDESEFESNDDIFSSPNAMIHFPLWFAVGVVAANPEQAPVETRSEPATAKTPRLILVSGGRKQLDARKWPVWGNVDGTYVIAEMFDYTCEHCRNTHRAVRDASTQLGKNFGVVMLPVPLHRDCNDAAKSSAPERADACEIARIAISVWLIDHTKFSGFHDWLFEKARNASDTKAKAELLVGKKRLSEELAKSTAEKYIAKNVMLYKEAGGGTVPKIIFPTTTLVGEVSKGTTIADFSRRKAPR